MRKPKLIKNKPATETEYVKLLLLIEQCKTEKDFQFVYDEIQSYLRIYKDQNYYDKLTTKLSTTRVQKIVDKIQWE